MSSNKRCIAMNPHLRTVQNLTSNRHTRRAYFRAYYWLTAERRRALARRGKQTRYWLRWLLEEVRSA